MLSMETESLQHGRKSFLTEFKEPAAYKPLANFGPKTETHQTQISEFVHKFDMIWLLIMHLDRKIKNVDSSETQLNIEMVEACRMFGWNSERLEIQVVVGPVCS